MSALSGLAGPFRLLSFLQSQQLADLTPKCLLPTQTIQTIPCIFNSSSTSSQGPILVSKTLHKPLRLFFSYLLSVTFVISIAILVSGTRPRSGDHKEALNRTVSPWLPLPHCVM